MNIAVDNVAVVFCAKASWFIITAFAKSKDTDMAIAIIKFVSIILLFMVTTVDIGARMVLNGFKYRKNRKLTI